MLDQILTDSPSVTHLSGTGASLIGSQQTAPLPPISGTCAAREVTSPGSWTGGDVIKIPVTVNWQQWQRLTGWRIPAVIQTKRLLTNRFSKVEASGANYVGTVRQRSGNRSVLRREVQLHLSDTTVTAVVLKCCRPVFTTMFNKKQTLTALNI